MKNFLIIILLIPYSIYSLLEPGVTFLQGTILLISVLIVGLILNSIYKLLPFFLSKELFLVSFLYFFYGHIVFKDTLHVIHVLKFHYFSIYFFCFLFLMFIIFKYFKIEYENSLVNFILIFSLTIIPVKYFSEYLTELNADNYFEKINENSFRLKENCEIKNNEPIVLIILDELSSEEELIKSNIIPDLKPLSFSKNASIKKQFISQSKQTKISLPSIFNYNLSNDSIIKKYESKDEYLTTSEDLLIKLFKNNKLIKDLKKKNWSVNSFGLVDFDGGVEYSNFTYEWDRLNKLIGPLGENVYVETFFKLSVINYFEKRDFRQKFPMASRIRKDVFNVLDTIKYKKRNFYYFHLYMPHFPYHYPGEFNYKEENLANYNSYRNFTLNKLSEVLDDFRYDKVKLIVSGDHGYRWDSIVNPYQTTGWFRGFNDCDLNEVKSVQDIGSLIINSVD